MRSIRKGGITYNALEKYSCLLRYESKQRIQSVIVDWIAEFLPLIPEPINDMPMCEVMHKKVEPLAGSGRREGRKV